MISLGVESLGVRQGAGYGLQTRTESTSGVIMQTTRQAADVYELWYDAFLCSIRATRIVLCTALQQ